MRVVVVDDMALARQRLQRLLTAQPDVEVVASCAGAAEAVDTINRLKPDAVFLDIQMPEMDGFGVFSALGAHMPCAVFVTAYEEFAVRAFDVQAADYLLKPVTEARVVRALHRVRRRLTGTRPPSRNQGLPARFVVKTAGRSVVVPVDDLYAVLAEGNYVRLCVAGRSYLMRETLAGMSAQLDGARFVRIHRSAIVNVDVVQSVKPLVNGDQEVTLIDRRVLTASRTHRKALLDALT